ncbi:MAG TPA: hypothetical protein VJ777_29495, partial [Mycobacterium sp.]|nr:hypothetical protein [Mycobacterium sp.]
WRSWRDLEVGHPSPGSLAAEERLDFVDGSACAIGERSHGIAEASRLGYLGRELFFERLVCPAGVFEFGVQSSVLLAEVVEFG